MKLYVYAKQVILGMAFDRPDAILHMRKLAETLMFHMVKCIVYGNSTGNYNHWIEDEISSYLASANAIRLKPSNKKPKLDMFNRYLFGMLGDDVQDAGVCIATFRAWNQKKQKYPDFVPTEEQAIRMNKATQNLKRLVLPLLGSKNDYSMDDFKPIVHRAIDGV